MSVYYIKVEFYFKYNNYPKRWEHFYLLFDARNYQKLIEFIKEIAKIDGAEFELVSAVLYIENPSHLKYNYKYAHVRDSIFSRYDILIQKQRKKEWLEKTDAIWDKINKEKP